MAEEKGSVDTSVSESTIPCIKGANTLAASFDTVQIFKKRSSLWSFKTQSDWQHSVFGP
jgi:hypothetical protein